MSKHGMSILAALALIVPVAGSPWASPDAGAARDLKAVTVAFWDATLRGDAAAKAFLASDGLAKETSGRATLERR